MKKLILTLLATSNVFAFANVAHAEYQHFHSKGYAVGCSVDSDEPIFVGCSIKGDYVKHHYKPTEECELDWGQNFALNAKTGKAEIECAGDTYIGVDGSKLLKVGQTVKGNGWTCTAIAGDGIKCIANNQKHGFILNKSKQILINK
ncbi:DUF6636 domain-containing protein [Faucicola mancuniensis]|uniref:DUF6636 domain-containing protein n=1 Tax=Faucicola mancuniensis TaxID=1309795 RepID=UPI0039773657